MSCSHQYSRLSCEDDTWFKSVDTRSKRLHVCFTFHALLIEIEAEGLSVKLDTNNMNELAIPP